MKIEVYTKPQCSYCDKAKALLDAKGLDYEVISAVDYRDALIERVTALTGSPPKSVPQIIFNTTEYVGGYDQLKALFDNHQFGKIGTSMYRLSREAIAGAAVLGVDLEAELRQGIYRAMTDEEKAYLTDEERQALEIPDVH